MTDSEAQGRFGTPVEFLYPYVSKDWPPPARFYGAVEVRVKVKKEERWLGATLLQAMSGPRGCMVVLTGERRRVKDDEKTPIARYVDWTRVRPKRSSRRKDGEEGPRRSGPEVHQAERGEDREEGEDAQDHPAREPRAQETIQEGAQA